ncbi:unnamed protein product [Brassica oleracea var. botrytis]
MLSCVCYFHIVYEKNSGEECSLSKICETGKSDCNLRLVIFSIACKRKLTALFFFCQSYFFIYLAAYSASDHRLQGNFCL